MLGANVGTALIVTVLSFNAVVASAPLILLGVVLFRMDRNPTSHDLGRVFIGLGLMLLALHQMLAVLEPISASPDVVTILSVFGSMPVLAVLLGGIAAWAVHSSVAVILLIASLTTNGIISMEPALMLVLGANVGTAINPLIEASGAKSGIARRLPIANLANRVFGMLVASATMPLILELLARLGFSPTNAVAAFHLVFNFALAAFMLPILDSVARDALTSTGSRQLISVAKARDDVLDSLNNSIRHYLAGFSTDELSELAERRQHQILVFATNMEQAGDVIDGNLLPHAAKHLKRGLLPSQDHESELVAMMDRLIANTRTAASLFMSDDARLARDLASQKLFFRKAEHDATSHHFDRMRDGVDAASQSAGLQVDLMRNMKLINSHIVAAAAYPVLERAGELLPMRLAASVGLE